MPLKMLYVTQFGGKCIQSYATQWYIIIFIFHYLATTTHLSHLNVCIKFYSGAISLIFSVNNVFNSVDTYLLISFFCNNTLCCPWNKILWTYFLQTFLICETYSLDIKPTSYMNPYHPSWMKHYRSSLLIARQPTSHGSTKCSLPSTFAPFLIASV